MQGTNDNSMTPTEPYAMPLGEQHAAQARLIEPVEIIDSPATAPAAAAELPKLPPVPTGEINAIADTTSKLAHVLMDADLTIATAESLTGGAVAAELVRVPGISESFQGGIVAYQYEVKTKLLGVDASLLAAAGAVNAEVALQMAQGVRGELDTDARSIDIGVSTTGVAGPDPADGHPAGTVFVGISSLWGERVVKLDFSNLVRADDPVGSRQRIRMATVEATMFNLLEHLLENAEDDR